MAQKRAKKKPTKPTAERRWPFGKRNYIMLAIALAVIIIGYISLGQGSITLAPLLLVIGYCVLIPVALLIKDPARTGTETEAEQAPPAE